MSLFNARSITLQSLAYLALFAVAVGCAHVKPEQLDMRLADLRAELREEISETDGRVTTLGNRVDALETRADNLERELERLARELSTTVERLESALRFNIPVHFAFDEAELTGDAREALNRFASVVREHHPDYLVTVEGFTDPAGTAAYNLDLGMQRAQAVEAFLTTEAGLTADRVRAVSYGEAGNRLVAPQSQGPGQEGWENRRVALVVDYVGR
jgi:peptidoglycan-associated lipoprotein